MMAIYVPLCWTVAVARLGPLMSDCYNGYIGASINDYYDIYVGASMLDCYNG
jgi:hypothetical protein